MSADREPSTEAGRALLATQSPWSDGTNHPEANYRWFRNSILDIEDQSKADLLAQIEKAVLGLPFGEFGGDDLFEDLPIEQLTENPKPFEPIMLKRAAVLAIFAGTDATPEPGSAEYAGRVAIETWKRAGQMLGTDATPEPER